MAAGLDVLLTPDNHLRHSRFVALRDDKKPKDVRREG
jgi:ATP-dependent DNA ligase